MGQMKLDFYDYLCAVLILHRIGHPRMALRGATERRGLRHCAVVECRDGDGWRALISTPANYASIDGAKAEADRIVGHVVAIQLDEETVETAKEIVRLFEIEAARRKAAAS